MAQPAWHYSNDTWSTACGRSVYDVAIVTSEPRDATCKKCVSSVGATEKL